MECKANENICLFELGEPCLGPITRAGCDAWCTSNRRGCWGCRGPAGVANISGAGRIMTKYGFSRETLVDRLECFRRLQHACLNAWLRKRGKGNEDLLRCQCPSPDPGGRARQYQIVIKHGKVQEADWEVVETPRFFEAMLVGKHWENAPYICGRICGICSIGHTLASIRAVENAFEITPSLQTEQSAPAP